MNEDDTLPPNTPRTWLKRAFAWAKANPDYAWPAGAFVLGVVVGWALL